MRKPRPPLTTTRKVAIALLAGGGLLGIPSYLAARSLAEYQVHARDGRAATTVLEGTYDVNGGVLALDGDVREYILARTPATYDRVARDLFVVTAALDAATYMPDTWAASRHDLDELQRLAKAHVQVLRHAVALREA